MDDNREVWSKGAVYGPNNSEVYTAGITINSHHNAVECFGNSADEVAMRRDLILLVVRQLTFVKVL